MIKKRSVKSIALLLGLMMALTGCGNQADEVYEENIELLEPVNTVSNVEIASKRDLYQTTILSAAVFPTTTEYSFTVGTNVIRLREIIIQAPANGPCAIRNACATISGGMNHESQNHTRLHRMQAEKLRHNQKQEE